MPEFAVLVDWTLLEVFMVQLIKGLQEVSAMGSLPHLNMCESSACSYRDEYLDDPNI